MGKFISLVINCDSRVGFQNNESTAEHMLDGCRSIDFMTEGIRNKQAFFKGFELETIVFLDEHEKIPESVVVEIRSMVDTLVIRKHDKRFDDMKEYPKFNDLNYLAALQLARGRYVAHFDSDSAAFTRNDFAPTMFIDLLGQFDYVSYPSHWSPKPVEDPSFDYSWCSTRFFMCKREALDFTEIQRCLLSDEYLYGKYPASRKLGWTEHILGLLAKYNGNGVYYPKVDLDNYVIFSWSKYIIGTLAKINAMSYDEVKNYIEQAGGIQYPNDIVAH